MASTKEQTSTDELLFLRDLIRERTGLFFRNQEGIECVEARLSGRLEKIGCGTFAEYYRFLSGREKAADAEWLQVIAALSKPVSGFYRHSRRVQLLTEMVLPQLAAK